MKLIGQDCKNISHPRYQRLTCQITSRHIEKLAAVNKTKHTSEQSQAVNIELLLYSDTAFHF